MIWSLICTFLSFGFQFFICEHTILVWNIMYKRFDLSWLLIHEMWDSLLGLEGFCLYAIVVLSLVGLSFMLIFCIRTELYKWVFWKPKTDRTEPNLIRFGSVRLTYKKMNQLVDILYQPIGSVQLVFRPKSNKNRRQTPLITTTSHQ